MFFFRLIITRNVLVLILFFYGMYFTVACQHDALASMRFSLTIKHRKFHFNIETMIQMQVYFQYQQFGLSTVLL